jgi:hypothetical protein
MSGVGSTQSPAASPPISTHSKLRQPNYMISVVFEVNTAFHGLMQNMLFETQASVNNGS